MIHGISIVIITRDAEDTLEHTLSALERFDDVVVYDNGSTDSTLSIAQSYANVRLFQGEFFGFGPTKRHAVSLAHHDWVLALDADEHPDPALLQALESWNCDPERNAAGKVRRANLLLGKAVRHSGWGNDWLIRLYNRRYCNFTAAMVHESVAIQTDTEVTRLPGTIIHQAVNDLSQFLEKVNRYSSIRAKNTPSGLSPALILGKSAFAFVRTYLFRLGFLDGWRGVVIAFSNANGVFWKHMKAHACRDVSRRHQP